MRGLMREFPREVIIGTTAWKVRFKRDLGGNTLGITCPTTETIFIRMKQTPKERLRTFFHELMHAVEFEQGVEIQHEAIYQLEALADVFAANAWVIWADWHLLGTVASTASVDRSRKRSRKPRT